MVARFITLLALSGLAWSYGKCGKGGSCSTFDLDDDQDEAATLQVRSSSDSAWFNNKKKKSCLKKKALLVIDMQNDFIAGSLPVADAGTIIPKVNELSALDWGAVVFTMDFHPANHISFAVNSPFEMQPFQSLNLSYDESNRVCGNEYVELYGDSANADCKMGDANVTAFEQTLWPAHCTQGTWGQKLDSRVVVSDEAVVVKKGVTTVADSYGAFQNNIETARGESSTVEYNILSENDLGIWLEKLNIDEVFVIGLALDYCVKYSSLQAKNLGMKTSVVTDATKPVAEATGKAALQALKEGGVQFATSAEVLARFGK